MESSSEPSKRDLSGSFRARTCFARFNAFRVPESMQLILIAVVLGALVGLAAVLFRELIRLVQWAAFDWLAGLITPIAPAYLIVIPMLGGLLVGLITTYLSPEARGSGIPQTIEAISLRHGHIRKRVMFTRLLASSICIGTGGSAGREGPIVHVSASIASTIGQFFHVSNKRMRLFVACGAAGGVAATFNTPIAGALFALEVILRQFSIGNFGAVVVSSVTAAVIGHWFVGDEPIFFAPFYTLQHPQELLLYLLLGIVCGLAGILFKRLLFLIASLGDRSKLPAYLKPVIGMALLGGIGLLSAKVDGIPRVFGIGYASVNDALRGNLLLPMAFSLLFLKMIATSFTIGADGSGGVFAPSLFMGAMLGYGFGGLVNLVFPVLSAPQGAYALVGMAAFFGGVAFAPMTAILMQFEMTGNYDLILPLMLATVISTVVARLIDNDSLFIMLLGRRGVVLPDENQTDLMRRLTVFEVMRREFLTLAPTEPISRLRDLLRETHLHSFPVVDDERRLLGMVTLSDYERAKKEDIDETAPIEKIASKHPLWALYPDDSMWEALDLLGRTNVNALPILDPSGSRKVVGLISRASIPSAYRRALLLEAREQYRSEALRVGDLNGINFLEVEIPLRAPVVGERISEIGLPDECLVVSVRRGRRVFIADGSTDLRAGDWVTVFAAQDAAPMVRKRLTGMPLNPGEMDALGERMGHLEIALPAGSRLSGVMVRDLQIPPNCVLVSIRREAEMVVPRGDVALAAGDVIDVFGTKAKLEEFSEYLTRD
ncbi:MAG: chloride channel protein [Anaerolineaceae bacterium]|nr:chloride channel protein [Anaerolineaceae bacterium]